jgi:hypothetical protein
VSCTHVVDGKVELIASSETGLLEVDFLLNFPDERMLFDINNGFRVSDDGSEHSARQIVSALQFISDYIGNGKLHIVNTETGSLLGRKDAYVPINIIPGLVAEHYDQLIDKYQAETETRAMKTQRRGCPRVNQLAPLSSRAVSAARRLCR